MIASGSTRGGSGRGGLRRRSSNFVMRFDFQSRRWTCHVPRAKEMIGIRAATHGLLAKERKAWCSSILTENNQPGSMLAPNTDNLRWMVDNREPSLFVSQLPAIAQETGLLLATSGAG